MEMCERVLLYNFICSRFTGAERAVAYNWCLGFLQEQTFLLQLETQKVLQLVLNVYLYQKRAA